MSNSRRFSKNYTKEKKEYDSNLLDLRRVTRVSAGGKKLRFRAVVVVGNRKGKVGLGVSKGLDVAQAVEKATRLAKKNIILVPLEGSSIYTEVKGHFGASDIILRSQKEGRGLVAGGVVRVICDLAGIKDISSKMIGRTRNKLNNARATMRALKKLEKYALKKNETHTVEK